MTNLNIVSENMNSTVIAKYEGFKNKLTTYQSESELEKEFIVSLKELSYEYLNFNSEEELILNLKSKLENLNNHKFTKKEWDYLFNDIIANSNKNILDKTKIIQENYIHTLKLDNGDLKNIYFIDKDNIHNNNLQIINQYEKEGHRLNIYDVTILINGFPLVHVELKRRGVDLREAFNQINRYQRDSFWSGSGLYEYIQIFVISNGTYTKYYSNTTRDLHINSRMKKKSNTFEFTSYWADQNNNAIIDLMDFSKTFFPKHTLLNIITKYCVLTTDDVLLVMRPYQIVATEKIINRIQIANNYKYYGSIKAGGYIWHTTGSGKTLTSFKTAQLVTKLEFIDKVLFVVDRKDLDYQTMKEYDKFKRGAANSNISTKVLEQQLRDDSKIIITTIQKLNNLIKKYPKHEVFDKQIVFIFDECHRSQFGNMHRAIVKNFKKYYLFGFTGTPIFSKNVQVIKSVGKITKQVFGERLHTYTIVDAINDKNVLRFRYEFLRNINVKEDVKDEKVYGINKEKVFEAPERIALIANYIVDNFARKTKNNEVFLHSSLGNVFAVAKGNKIKEQKIKKYVNGFNSILAVSSISLAKGYYEAFKNINDNPLKIAIIYSYAANQEENDFFDEENSESTENLNKTDRDFLESAIKDYNKMFMTNYDTSSEKFQNYYKDVSLRMKNREIDILIVVNMFLTGFDAKTLNTLWVDKNLKWHGLIQAFSRTNRILNSVKTYGNIISFRNLEDNLEKSLSLFGNKDASGIVLLRKYEDYYNGYMEDGKHYKGYVELVTELKDSYEVGKLVHGEGNQKNFIKLFGQILKVRNILSAFDQFENDNILTTREEQDYRSIYIDLYNEMKQRIIVDKVDIIDDVVFEMELVRQIEVNVDYILSLIEKYFKSNMEDKEVLITIDKAIMSSPDLRNKKELIEEFISTINANSDVYNDFNKFMNCKKIEELDKLIEEENLNKEKTYEYIKRSFERGGIETVGVEVVEILPPMSLFIDSKRKYKKKEMVITKLKSFFEKFFNLSNNKF